MKRKALLLTTGCTTKMMESWTARGLSPLSSVDGNWNDYQQDDGITLRLMVMAAKGTDVNSASKLASAALRKLYPVHPLFYTDGVELWAALVHYDWPDAPEEWDARTVIAGRWCDLQEQAENFVAGIDEGAKVNSIYAVSVTKAALDFYHEAKELGLAEGEGFPAVPFDLTGFPDWFVDCETRRREVVFSKRESEAE
jgi:hypothetical protein